MFPTILLNMILSLQWRSKMSCNIIIRTEEALEYMVFAVMSDYGQNVPWYLTGVLLISFTGSLIYLSLKLFFKISLIVIPDHSGSEASWL